MKLIDARGYYSIDRPEIERDWGEQVTLWKEVWTREQLGTWYKEPLSRRVLAVDLAAKDSDRTVLIRGHSACTIIIDDIVEPEWSELVDAADSKSAAARRAGSSPASGTAAKDEHADER